MSRRNVAVGSFIVAGMTLFGLGIFLVGSRHEAFTHHVLLYTEFNDLDGITMGSKVQVAGMDAGQVTRIDVPQSPTGHFRVQMKVDDQLHGLASANRLRSHGRH
jgi:phospholipid/cholesterol/gamma-HCH transport system substrate-binding protein